MTAHKLESAILSAVARVSVDEWVPCTVGDLRNLLRQIDVEGANATINSIAEAITSLAQAGYLLTGKREDGGRRLPFDFQKQLDQSYISNFFARGGFELKLSHQGRKQMSVVEPLISVEEPEDRKFARLAIDEARKSISERDGRPHPMVGAVVVKNGQVLASAHRGELEGNHAEYLAMEKRLADAAVAGATIYTTLEPCTTRNHPKIPCAERLIERKVRRVVIGMLDPDPRITGRGQRKLRRANIITEFFPHDLMAEVEELNREFTRHYESTIGTQESAPQKLEVQSGMPLQKTTDLTRRKPNLVCESSQFPDVICDPKTGVWHDRYEPNVHIYKACVLVIQNDTYQDGKGVAAIDVRAQITWRYDNDCAGPVFSPAAWLDEECGKIDIPVGWTKKLLIGIKCSNYWDGYDNRRIEASQGRQSRSEMVPNDGTFTVKLIDSADEVLLEKKFNWTTNTQYNWPRMRLLPL